MAPESLIRSIYSQKTDVWSFGVLLWEIMTLGRKPYAEIENLHELIQFVEKGNRMEQPKNCPNEM